MVRLQAPAKGGGIGGGGCIDGGGGGGIPPYAVSSMSISFRVSTPAARTRKRAHTHEHFLTSHVSAYVKYVRILVE